jgi:hypothetical protein
MQARSEMNGEILRAELGVRWSLQSRIEEIAKSDDTHRESSALEGFEVISPPGRLPSVTFHVFAQQVYL